MVAYGEVTLCYLCLACVLFMFWHGDWKADQSELCVTLPLKSVYPLSGIILLNVFVLT